MLQTCENQLHQGKHPICQTSEKPKSAANIRKPALPGRTSDKSNIRKTEKCSKHPNTSFTMANIRYVKHPKNQKMLETSEKQIFQGKHPICLYPRNQKLLQTCENQLYQGKHPICQTFEKPKTAANIRKPALPGQTSDMSNNQKPKSAANIRKAAFAGQTSDMSNIRKNKKCCKHPKSSFSMANIRCVKHLKKQKVLQTCENQLYQGKHPNVKHLKNQKVLQTSENQLYHGEHSICQTSEKIKSAANIRKAAFPGQTTDVSNIRKTKMWCKHAKTSFTRANIRYFKHPKNQKVLQLSENQLYHGKLPICQTSKKPKSAANIRKAAFPGQTSDMSNIRKTKKCCKHAKTSFTRANIRYFKHPKNQKVLQICENQFYEGTHPIRQTFKD